MPLSDQEQRCIEKACNFLAITEGGTWEAVSYPTELFPQEKTPEVVVTNGTMTAAIEVKRLTGDAMSQVYSESLFSNEKYLTPPCGGYYSLEPPVDFRLPLSLPQRKYLKKQIAQEAPALKPEESGVVLVPRKGHIALASENEPSMIHCLHSTQYGELLSPVVSKIRGRYMLIDEGCEHSFFTDDGRKAFQNIVVEACERRLRNGDASHFTWQEEWRLTRGKEAETSEDEGDGVWIIAVTEAREVRDSVKECMEVVLESALAKFASKKWGDVQIIVLESSTYAPADFVIGAVSSAEAGDLTKVDYVLLVDSDKLIECYPRT